MVYSSVSKTIMIYKLNANVPKPIILKLYYALTDPYLIYCNIKWGGCSEVHLHKILLLLQKKVVRSISGEDFYHHSNPLFIANEILKIPYSYSNTVVQFCTQT